MTISRTWRERLAELPQTGMTTEDFIAQELANLKERVLMECAAIVEDLHDFHKPADDPWNLAIAKSTECILFLKKP